jgi:hypothetical protein
MKTKIFNGFEFTNQNLPLPPAAPKHFSRDFTAVIWFLFLTLYLLPASAAPMQLVSARDPFLPPPVGGGNAESVAPSLSPDGRFVVFSSAANDLV